MSEVPTRLEINCETGEQTIIPLTVEEIAQMETDRIAYEEAQAAAQAEADANEATRQSGIAKLMVLGLTEEEAQALVK
jgi:hypothetical protein